VSRPLSRTTRAVGYVSVRRLVKERTAHGNGIKGLLKTQGIMDFDPRAADAAARLSHHR
jgi:transposase